MEDDKQLEPKFLALKNRLNGMVPEGWRVTLTKVPNKKTKMRVTLFSPKGDRIRSRHLLKNYCSDHHLDIQDFGDVKFFYNSEFLPNLPQQMSKKSAMALALERMREKRKTKKIEEEPLEITVDEETDSQMMHYSDLDSDLNFSPDEINGIPIHDTWTYYGAIEHPVLGPNGQFFWPRSSVEHFGYFRLKNLKLKVIVNENGEKEMRPVDPDPELTDRIKTNGKQDNMIVTHSVLGNRPKMSISIEKKLDIPTEYKLGSSLNEPLIHLLPKLPSNALTFLTPSCDQNTPDPYQEASAEKKAILSNISVSCYGACTVYGDINSRLENPEYEQSKNAIIVRPKGFTKIPFHLADYDLFRNDI